MDNTIKALKLFADNKGGSFTIKKAGETLGMNYRIVYEEIIGLEKKGLLKIEKTGNANVCSFNYKFGAETAQVEEIRRIEALKDSDVYLIHKRISEIKNPFYILLLFGSRTKKPQSKGSDIDICLITDSKEVSREVAGLLSVTPMDIHFQEFTTKEFMSMIKSRTDNVGNEILKGNVILHGVESFYEMVNNAE